MTLRASDEETRNQSRGYRERQVSTGEYIERRYRLERMIAEGGTADIHLGYDMPAERRVAIKIHRSSDSARAEIALRQYERETSLARQLGNEHVVRYDLCGRLPTGQPFLIMEYLDGCDLSKVCKWAGGNLKVDSVIDWVCQACEGLIPFHEHGIAHRDLKPANIFLTKSTAGDREVIKLVDLSLASRPRESVVEEAATHTNLAGFSIGYAPREQLFGTLGDADVRSDVFALAAVAFRLLTGRRPFVRERKSRSEEDLDIVEQMKNQGAPLRISALRDDVPREMEAILMRCLSHDPSKRPEDARRLLDLLQPFRACSSGVTVERAERGARPGARSVVRISDVAVVLCAVALSLIASAACAASALSAARQHVQDVPAAVR